MKPEQIYQELNDLAEKLQITVSEQNFRTTGIAVQSGLCKVRGKNVFIMDKHKSIHKKIKILAAHLAEIHHENVFMVPAVRDLLEKQSD
jgi:ABC-type enterochelin transport system substrate-binding protein